MKKIIGVIVAIALVVVIAVKIYIPIYEIDRTYEYDIDKENGEVTITKYLGDDRAWERYHDGTDKELSFPETVEIPEKIKGYPVTTIGENAFAWCKAKKIVLPDTVVDIEDGAFEFCKNLECLQGVENVENIGKHSLADTESLKTINITKYSRIGESAFAGSGIGEMKIPEGIKIIPECMCMGMKNLTKIEIPDSVVKIEGNAFSYCESLEEICIPENVTEIGFNVFFRIEDNITIVGEKGSCAEQYAIENGIKFRQAE